MVNPEKQIKLGEIDPDYRRKLKESQFKFSEKEKAKKMEEGMNEEEIEEKEKNVIARQGLEHQGTPKEYEIESEKGQADKKMSFEEYKNQQENKFQEALKAARKEKDAAYEDKEEEE